ncbi:MAG TPA: hypothetical protein VND94_18490 [Terriglobia bacterium]|nr:hypothetical protein [Terriglobia bacterium]
MQELIPVSFVAPQPAKAGRSVAKRRLSVLALMAALLSGGCAEMTEAQRDTIIGGIAGAATGIMIGTLGGNTALGAGVGTGAGLLGGYIYSLNHRTGPQ